METARNGGDLARKGAREGTRATLTFLTEDALVLVGVATGTERAREGEWVRLFCSTLQISSLAIGLARDAIGIRWVCATHAGA